MFFGTANVDFLFGKVMLIRSYKGKPLMKGAYKTLVDV
jgi:hypothetical protein